MRHRLTWVALISGLTTILATTVACGGDDTGGRLATLEAENATLRAALSVTPTPTATPVPPTATQTPVSLVGSAFCTKVSAWRTADSAATDAFNALASLDDILDSTKGKPLFDAFKAVSNVAIPLPPEGLTDAGRLADFIANKNLVNDKFIGDLLTYAALSTSTSTASVQQRVDARTAYEADRTSGNALGRSIEQYALAVCGSTSTS